MALTCQSRQLSSLLKGPCSMHALPVDDASLSWIGVIKKRLVYESTVVVSVDMPEAFTRRFSSNT